MNYEVKELKSKTHTMSNIYRLDVIGTSESAIIELKHVNTYNDFDSGIFNIKGALQCIHFTQKGHIVFIFRFILYVVSLLGHVSLL